MLTGLWGLFNHHWWLFLVMGVLDSIDTIFFSDAQWATILSLVLELLVGLVVGHIGNEWAWKEERITSSQEEADQFDQKQKRWNIAGIIVAIPVGIILFMLIFD